MPITIGYHASHEQFAPSALLALVRKAEQAGFAALLSSDHFHPWSRQQGQSGFAFSWMGAALAVTKLPCGMVTAPGQRFHPALTAQALATLGEMFPGRVWAALGSGQALNESITGEGWPAKAQRNQRLLECVHVMRALLRGETVNHRGLVQVEEATLYTRPETPPPLLGAALTPETAAWVAGWADGLITISRPPSELAPVVQAFRDGGGAGKPLYLKAQLSWHRDERRARESAHAQWATNIFASHVLSDLRSPLQFEALAAHVKPEQMDDAVLIVSDPRRLADALQAYAELGFTHLYLHNVNREQEAFIDACGEHVLPSLQR